MQMEAPCILRFAERLQLGRKARTRCAHSLGFKVCGIRVYKGLWDPGLGFFGLGFKVCGIGALGLQGLWSLGLRFRGLWY